MREVTLHDLTFEPFISAEEIDRTVTSLAAQIDNDYRGRNPILLIVLNGAFIFAADLVRKINIPIRLDFIKISSYKGTASSGEIKSFRIGNHHVVFPPSPLNGGKSPSSIVDLYYNIIMKISSNRYNHVAPNCLSNEEELFLALQRLTLID